MLARARGLDGPIVSITVLPLASASPAPFTAICSICRLLSAFCDMEALICSRLDVVSWTEAACALVPWDNVCDEDATWLAAAEMAPVAPRTSPITCPRRSDITRIEERSCPASSVVATWIS